MGIKGLNVEKIKKNLSDNHDNDVACRDIINPKRGIEHFIVVQTSAATPE